MTVPFKVDLTNKVAVVTGGGANPIDGGFSSYAGV
jgi:hypothetical protein